jgi:hypothetical protein
MPSDAKGEIVRDLKGLFTSLSISENSTSPESIHSPESGSTPRRDSERINPDTVLGGLVPDDPARRHDSPEFSWGFETQKKQHDGFSKPYSDR